MAETIYRGKESIELVIAGLRAKKLVPKVADDEEPRLTLSIEGSEFIVKVYTAKIAPKTDPKVPTLEKLGRKVSFK